MSNKHILEHSVESYLVRRCEEQGWMCVKFIPDHKAGFPDRLILMPEGKCAWAETKRPVGGRLSDLQIVQHKLLRDAGQAVYVPHSKAEVDEVISILKA